MARDIDDDILTRRLASALRSPAQGKASHSTANASSGISAAAVATDTVVDDSNKVRRLWTPGDPWNDDYYFGGA